MKKISTALVSLFCLLVAYLLFWPVPIDPVPFVTSKNPGATGDFSMNKSLSSVKSVLNDIGLGPEDVTKGDNGFFYTGLQDGRIIRFTEDEAIVENFVNTGGRPLGMQFDTKGNLIVADAFKGLLSISPSGDIAVLTDNIEGEKFLFTDDLDIAQDGTIWFTDASKRFDQHNWLYDFWETRPTGRLLSYNPHSKETKIELDNLMFANGVALGPDDKFILINETIGARIKQLWLKGEKTGQVETFIEGLPAYPDNLSYNDDGIFWVALPSPRLDDLEKLWGNVFIRKLLIRLPESLRAVEPTPFYGWVIGIDESGKIVHNFQDPEGSYGTITSVNQFDEELYFGSIAMSSVGKYKLPDAN